MGTNRINKDERREKISNTLREKAKLGILPWQITAKEKREKERIEYESIPKTCKHCGSLYYKAWTKSGKSDFCSSKCARGYSTSKKREEINKKVSQKLKGISTQKNNENVLSEYNKNPKYCLICGKALSYYKRSNKTCSKDCGIKMSVLTNRERGTYEKIGGYREGSGRSKSGYYKGFFCGSTYELVYYIYCLDHNIRIERNTKSFPYEWGGKTKLYFPDFRIDEGLVEIKGYHTDQVDAKLKSVDEPIKILYLKDLEPMMKYVDETYMTQHKGKGNNYHVLYDNYKPKYTYKCDYCGKEFSRERKVTSEIKFCSVSCAAKHRVSVGPDLYTKDFIENNTINFEDFSFIRIDKENNLYSNKRKFKNGDYEKLSFEIKNGKRRYRLRDNNRKLVYRYL